MLADFLVKFFHKITGHYSENKNKSIYEMSYSEILEETKQRRIKRSKTFLARLFSTSTL